MKNLLPFLRYILSVQVGVLFLLFLIRVVFYFINLDKLSTTDVDYSLFLKAMLKGVQFDNVIICYILVFPLLLFPFIFLWERCFVKGIRLISAYFICVCCCLFAFSIANIPYFDYYFTHMGASVLHWFTFGKDTAGMIFQERSFILFFVLFFVLATLFVWWSIRLRKKVIRQWERNSLVKYNLFIPVLLLTWLFCFAGIRGSFERYPIRTGTAYISTNAFYNQLGLNPVFYFMKSYSNFKKNKNYLEGTLSIEEAVKIVQQQLHIPEGTGDFSPLRRPVSFPEGSNRMNVVVILMESISSEYLSYTYQEKPLMPYMHRLIEESCYFENIYSAGIHTNNGIVATLYGFPTQFDRTMIPTDIIYHTGLPVNLKRQGYHNLFFLTGNPNYDNMRQFLLGNGFDRIYSSYDFPEDKVVNNYGVSDGYLLEFGLSTLNELAKEEEPFMATFLTISNHYPYVVPDDFKNRGRNDSECMVAYADATIEQFMESARQQTWFDNTLFVLVGDHGKIMGDQIYDMALSYNHVPLIFYSPAFTDRARRYDQMGSQIDIYPTVMELLGQSYVNLSPGESLFSHQRPFASFVSDTHLGCIDRDLFYIYNPLTKEESLFKYKERCKKNRLEQYPELVQQMKNYATSQLLTSDYIIRNGMSNKE